MKRELIFPPGATRHDWVFDSVLALGLGLLTVPIYLVSYLREYSRAEIIAAMLMIAPLILRRHSPILSLVGIAGAGAALLVISSQMSASMLALPVISYSMARWIPGGLARLSVLVGFVGSILAPARWFLPTAGRPSMQQGIFFLMAALICFGLVVTPYAIGRRVRESSQAHAERVSSAQTRQLQQARLAESRVRTQIARELHDIVAHSLSVMIVQAEGGRALAKKRPEAAAETLDTIAETGREALSEMRRILGVLRADPEDTAVEFAPAPSLTEIPDLVARTTDRAHLTVHGTPPRVSQAAQLTVYRVVQEALTNFLKHAGPDAKAEVVLSYGARQIVVEVTDNGAGADAATDNPGHGLKGMRERVASMGGFITAAPRPEGGFQVRAVIPFVLNDKEDVE
ncbi:MAG: sensor histidine kinase [Propionibacteriaceae bacterium]|jgi:signal transduction histidine kinase|nr:sensor histidine kinase [Propionibacteriaceae bacterium]